MKSKHSASPVSYPVNVARLPRSGLPVWLEADEEQRAALAAEHDLLGVESFRRDLLLPPWKGDGVKVSGRVAAAITQACVVTLEPVAARIDEAADMVFVPEGSKLAVPGWIERGEMVLDAEGPDAPETFSGDSVDVGALAEEFFALAIDPYPRKPGVSVEPPSAGEEAAAGSRGPLYEKLRGLADKS
jgi:hypothetical protein